MSKILDDLPNIQVFARDPETLSDNDVGNIIERMRKLVERARKVRQNEVEVAELAAKFKKANTAAAKKKAKVATSDPMETVV